MKKLNPVRTIILAGSLLLQLNTLCFQSRSAAGDVDLSFDPGSGVNGTVNAVIVQPDGKVLIGGQFTTVKGLARSGLARLNADGSGDPTFNASTVIGGSVGAVALQSDGKMLVSNNSLTRLNSDGSLDSSFKLYAVGGDIAVTTSFAVQPDGKVVVGGYTMTSTIDPDGNPDYSYSYFVTRVYANGSNDISFNSGVASGMVLSIAQQPDGKVLIGGTFTNVSGASRNGIARLNANGSLDNSFNAGTGADGGDGTVYSVGLQPDGKVLIGGYFLTVNGTNRNGIARLNANGSLDSSFNAGTGADGVVLTITLQSDNKVLIGGYFTNVNGTNRNNIARFNANGSLDSSFNPGTDTYGVVRSIALQPDGNALIGGDFNIVNGTNRNRMARLNGDGSLDGSFNPGRGLEGVVSGSIFSLTVQPDGKVLIDGFINGTNRYGRARLNVDGSVDTAFIPASFNPDLAAGFYVPCPRDLACENTLLHLSSFAVQPDGKVLVGGSYYHLEYDSGGFIVAEYFINRLARFTANGSLDGSFYFVDLNGGVNSITPQSDGKIIIVGEFTSKILRLNADGNQDYSFNPGTGTNGSVSSVALQPDGKVLIGGSFTNVSGVSRNGIARLNANSSLDSSFNPGTGVSGGSVWSVALQPDGKVLIGGLFTTVNDTNRNNIARLNANGSLDSSFNPGTGADNVVRSIALQPDGKVIIGGDFTVVNGAVRPRVARLYGDSAPSLNITRSNGFVIVSWPVTGLNFQLQESTNLFPAAWSPVAQAAVTNASQISVTLPTIGGRKFFRLKSP
jgi:uncharacterized delta-60 repeat protein